MPDISVWKTCLLQRLWEKNNSLPPEGGLFFKPQTEISGNYNTFIFLFQFVISTFFCFYLSFPAVTDQSCRLKFIIWCNKVRGPYNDTCPGRWFFDESIQNYIDEDLTFEKALTTLVKLDYWQGCTKIHLLLGKFTDIQNSQVLRWTLGNIIYSQTKIVKLLIGHVHVFPTWVDDNRHLVIRKILTN